MSRKTPAVACLLFAIAASASACLWDSDTLQMERQRFPGVLEIITGKFVRHSRAYYEWRITDRKQKLEAKPDDPALLDDLAVAYAKLGRPEEGIALLEPTLATRPNRYETLSNLGTLYFFAGNLDKSKELIRRALEINPNAHFGREKYQLLLTQYVQQGKREKVIQQRREGNLPPLHADGFAHHVLLAKFGPREGVDGRPEAEAIEELRVATRGVLGMMHFADNQSPILLEALGDLLVAGEIEENASQLAARAYLRAGKLATDQETAAHCLKLSERIVSQHIDFTKHSGHEPFSLEQQLASEVADANAWFASIEAQEKQWIAAGRDVDAEFAAVYYDSLEKTVAAAEQQLKTEPKQTRLSQQQSESRLIYVAGSFCIGAPLALIGATIGGLVWWSRRRQTRAK